MIKHDNQMFPSLSAIKCWWRRDLRSWIVGVLLCECLYLHGAAANICTWWMFWQLPTFSRNIILRASTRGPGQESAKTKPTTTDRHTFQETDCGGSSKIGLACISDLLLNRLHDLSLALSFSCSEQIPQDQNLLLAHHGCVAQGHEAGAMLPLHTLRPLQGGLSRLALKPFPCAAQAVEPKHKFVIFAEVCELKRCISESKVWKSRHYLTHVCTLTFPQQRHLHLLMWTNGHTNFLSALYVAETSLQLAWSEMVEDGVSDVVTSQSKAFLAAAMQMFDQSRL